MTVTYEGYSNATPHARRNVRGATNQGADYSKDEQTSAGALCEPALEEFHEVGEEINPLSLVGAVRNVALRRPARVPR